MITFETSMRRQIWAQDVYGERCAKLIDVIGAKREDLVWVFRAWQKGEKTSLRKWSKLKKTAAIYYSPENWYYEGERKLRPLKYADKHIILISFSRDVTDEELLWTIAHEYKHYLQHTLLGGLPDEEWIRFEGEIEADEFANSFVDYENPKIRKWAEYRTLKVVWEKEEKEDRKLDKQAEKENWVWVGDKEGAKAELEWWIDYKSQEKRQR